MSVALETHPWSTRFTRREIIEGGVFAFAGTLAAVYGWHEGQKQKEHLVPFRGHTLYADWVPTIPGEAEIFNIHPTWVPDNERLLQHLLGRYYKPRTSIASATAGRYLKKLLSDIPSSFEDDWETYGNEILSTAMESYGISGLVAGLVTRLAHHGVTVVNARNNLLKALGYRPDTVTMVPIQQNIHPRMKHDGTPFIVDKLGNIGIGLFVDGAGIGSDINRFRHDQLQGNFSFQTGNIDLFVILREKQPDGTIVQVSPKYSYIGPYQPDRAYSSLSSLVDMTDAVPDMNFDCALGNKDDRPTEQLRKLRADGIWKDNQDRRVTLVNEAMPVGKQMMQKNGATVESMIYRQWHGTVNDPSIGASVNTSAFRFGWGSSIATPIWGTIKDALMFRGVPEESVKEYMNEHVPETTGADGEPLRVIGDMESIRTLFAEERAMGDIQALFSS